MADQVQSTSEVVEREVIRLENNEQIEFEIPSDDEGTALKITVDPHDLYWKIVEWETIDGLEGVMLLKKLQHEIGCTTLKMTHMSQISAEIIRIAETRENEIKKKLESSRNEIAS